MWEADPTFKTIVDEAWTVEVRGSPMFKLVKKLSATKFALKKWNKEVFGPVQQALSRSCMELDNAQAFLQQCPHDPTLISFEQTARDIYTRNLFQEECFLRQKSRQLWLSSGDSNNKFFYDSLKSQSAVNTISRLKASNGTSLSTPTEIKDHIVQFYKDLLNCDSGTPISSLEVHGSLSEDENSSLLSSISTEEIRNEKVVFSFSISFPLLLAPPMLRSYNPFFLILSQHQAAFIKGRSIHHNILLAQNVKYLSSKGKSRLVLKWTSAKIQLRSFPTRKSHQVSWDTICKPFAEGGLGIKSIKDWSNGAAGVRFWEIAKNRQSMWAQWMRDRYLRKENLWIAKAHSCSSTTRLSILQAREWIAPKVRYLIFEGKSINLWYDPCLNGKGLQQILGWVTYDWGPLQDTTVAVFIRNGQWRKPMRSPAEINSLWDEIQQIEVEGFGKDILIWPSSKSGRLNLTEAWKAVRARGEDCQWISLSDDRGGYGALLRNNNADFIAGLAGRLDLHSINLLELKAIERGIQLRLSNAVTNLWIKSDSITAIAWGKHSFDLSNSGLRSEQLLRRTSLCEVMIASVDHCNVKIEYDKAEQGRPEHPATLPYLWTCFVDEGRWICTVYTCLTRGRTRKLSQRTLISFCSRLNDDVCNGEILANDAREKRTEETMKPCSSICLTESSSMTEEESNNREPEHCLPNNTDTYTNIILDNVVSEHASTDKEFTLSEASSFTPGTNVKADGMGTIDGVSVVLLTDSGSSHMLGFLPRELAEHLSPLIDKFHIKIEGSVTSLPNSSRGPWFRMANVSYPEISDSNNAIEGLHDAGHVCLFQSKGPSKCEVDEVMNALTKDICCIKKQELISFLSDAYDDGKCPMLPSMLLERSGIWVRVSCTADLLLWRVQALDVAEMMDHSLDANDLDTVMRCIEISDDFMSSSCKNISLTPFPDAATFLSCFTASWVYSKVVALGVSFFECEQRYGDSVRLLKGLLERITCDGRCGYWTLRFSIIWVISMRVSWRPKKDYLIHGFTLVQNWHYKSECYDGWENHQDVGNLPVLPSRLTDPSRNGAAGSSHYAEEGGWKGVHAESGIWLTIFGLVMWDVIFADIPNVFRTKFQTAPLDLNTDRFYMERESLIEAHLQKINEGMAEEVLIKSWQSHEETACRGVNWERHSLTDLRAAVSCIGGSCLASLCCHLAQDYRSWSSGMPDLLIWRFRGGETDGGEAKLVEVKSARGRLSEQQ
ncbi:hypothetical protein QJS10_CPA01g02277 [Acorus calamus]|uniref:Fanconi-associated nuclease n=1 Tax=Acorus calamus TaxID=4465 RepID=A0AAV9FIZ8_ACOCL|nr:hypothetical protein QJS10_CPA01g02277 [Acorus calamus]